jgi:hypothetical protein
MFQTIAFFFNPLFTFYQQRAGTGQLVNTGWMYSGPETILLGKNRADPVAMRTTSSDGLSRTS